MDWVQITNAWSCSEISLVPLSELWPLKAIWLFGNFVCSVLINEANHCLSSHYCNYSAILALSSSSISPCFLLHFSLYQFGYVLVYVWFFVGVQVCIFGTLLLFTFVVLIWENCVSCKFVIDLHDKLKLVFLYGIIILFWKKH